MDFSILVLGSGAATPTKTRRCSSQVVRIGPRRMLLDCGEATQCHLRQFHQRIQAIDTIFISHLHGDHFFGLPGLLSTMHLCGRTEPVRLFAPKGLRELLDILFKVSNTQLQYELEINELELDSPTMVMEDKYCRVTAFPLRHTVPVYGFLFEEVVTMLNLKKEVRTQYGLTNDQCISIKNGSDLVLDDGTVVANSLLTLPPKAPRRYAYCCDTAYCEDIIPVLKGADLMCIESTFGKQFETLAAEKCHCTAEQAAILAQKAGAQQLLLTHFSARYKDVEPLLEEARPIFTNVLAAEDGTIYQVPYHE